MALTGNCTLKTYTEHESDTTTITETKPDGSTKEVTTPTIIETTTNHENIYLSIKQLDNYHFYALDSENNWHKHTIIHFRFCGYKDQKTRNIDQENYLFSEVENLENYNHDNNLYEQIYNQIKQKEGFTNLIDG